jgi:hypothetical protein
MSFLKKLLIMAIASYGHTAFCQEAENGATETPPTETEIQTILDQSPFVSARASGMGGALSTLADGFEAAYYNPAGIGGLHLGKTSPGLLRGLQFPYIGVAANKNAAKLNSEFKSEGGATDRAIGQSIVDANAGKRQYGRASYAIDFTVGRTLTAAFSDVQFAAVKTTGQTADEGGISMKYRSLTGTGTGFSATDSQGRIYFGMFSSMNNMTLMSADNASYLDVINVDRRKDLIKANSTSWTGIATNAGFLWNFSKPWRPTLGVVARDIGNSTYKSSGATKEGGASQMLVEQDLTAGFSISPEMGRSGTVNVIVEGHHLTAKEMSLGNKFRAGVEVNLGGFGSNSTFGVRSGYGSAGASYGVNVNVGLIQLEVASEAIDIGVNNLTVSDRRSVAVFSVNLAND